MMDASAWLGGPEPLPDFCALCHAAQPVSDLGLSVRPAYTAHGLIGFRWSPVPWHFEGSAQVPRREAVSNCANCQEWRDEIESGRHVPQEGALPPFDWHDVLQHVCSSCQGATLEEGGAVVPFTSIGGCCLGAGSRREKDEGYLTLVHAPRESVVDLSSMKMMKKAFDGFSPGATLTHCKANDPLLEGCTEGAFVNPALKFGECLVRRMDIASGKVFGACVKKQHVPAKIRYGLRKVHQGQVCAPCAARLKFDLGCWMRRGAARHLANLPEYWQHVGRTISEREVVRTRRDRDPIMTEWSPGSYMYDPPRGIPLQEEPGRTVRPGVEGASGTSGTTSLTESDAARACRLDAFRLGVCPPAGSAPSGPLPPGATPKAPPFPEGSVPPGKRAPVRITNRPVVLPRLVAPSGTRSWAESDPTASSSGHVSTNAHGQPIFSDGAHVGADEARGIVDAGHGE